MDQFGIKAQSRFDYIFNTDPAADSNPPIVNVTWLNASTGDIFVCIDNTVGYNKWVGKNSSIESIDNLLAFYKLNGNVLSSTAKFHAQNTTQKYSDGVFGNIAVGKFSVTDYITIDDIYDEFDDGDPFTITANVLTYDNSIVYQTFLQIGDAGSKSGMSLNIGSSEGIYAQIGDGTTRYNSYTAGQINNDTWYNCIAVFDGTTLTLYVDNVQKTPVNGTYIMTSLGMIGESSGGLSGTIANVRIYNRALTRDEVTIVYSGDS